MRKSEIIHLSWDEVDLEKGFIRLHADRVKTKVARSIPLHPRVKQMLERQPRGLHSNRVFLRNGKPFVEIKKSFRTACQKPGLTDFTFYDLRHCALNNMRLAGNDYFRIMAISGNKTMAVFRRDNFVTKEELNQVRWLDSLMDTRGEVDTYMDTKRKRAKR